MTVIVTVRIPATLEQVRHAEEVHPGLYEEIIALAHAHGMLSHRRVYRDGEIMDIDEWPSEEARASFREEARPLVAKLSAARGSGPSTSEIWFPMPGAH